MDKEYSNHEESDKKVHAIHIKILDDGTFHYDVMSKCEDDEMMPEMKEYSFQNVDDLINAIKDDLQTPHIKKSPSEGGDRFGKMSSSSALKNPGVAIVIGMEKHGKEKMGKKRYAKVF